MKVEIREIDYQRNGISGEGFFQIIFDWNDLDENGSESGTGFIATFKSKECRALDHVDIPSTRVISPMDFHNAWRGDNFGYGIEKELSKMMRKYKVKRFYDIKMILNGEYKHGM